MANSSGDIEVSPLQPLNKLLVLPLDNSILAQYNRLQARHRVALAGQMHQTLLSQKVLRKVQSHHASKCTYHLAHCLVG